MSSQTDKVKVEFSERREAINKLILLVENDEKDSNRNRNRLDKTMLRHINNLYDLHELEFANYNGITGCLNSIVGAIESITALLKSIMLLLKDVEKTKEQQDNLKDAFDSTLGSLNEVIDKIKMQQQNLSENKAGHKIYG